MNIIDAVRRAVKEAGNQDLLAKRIGVSPTYISDVLHRRKEPGPKLLEPLGYERVVTYRRKAKETS